MEIFRNTIWYFQRNMKKKGKRERMEERNPIWLNNLAFLNRNNSYLDKYIYSQGMNDAAYLDGVHRTSV